MSIHLEREIQRLKKLLLSLSALVDEQLQLSVRAVLERDQDLANEVRERDEEVDRLEVEVEEECLKVLALHQPVAIDLRFIIAVLKINNDLERIGDLAVNVSRKTRAFAGLPLVDLPFELQEMSRKVQGMLRDCLDAMINLDTALANDVCTRDDEINDMKRTVRREVERVVCEHPDEARSLLRLNAVARNLERVGDLATNIAEDIIYMIEGKIVRHRDMD
jgi:phosphate transport system protein